MVSALDSGSEGPGSSPGRVIVLCSWARHFTLTVPLSTQEYKWVKENCQGNLKKCWEVDLGWTSIPSRGNSNRAFSRDVMSAILVYLNNEKSAILVYQISPVGV